MNNSPLLLIGSARNQSDTRQYTDFVFQDMEHRLLDLQDFHIPPYDYSGNYPADDDFTTIAEAMLAHQVIVFATPVYWYAMSGVMKIVFDRITDLVTIRKQTGRQLKGKSIYLLAVGSDAELPPGFEMPFELTANYLDMHYEGSVYFSTHRRVNPEEKFARKQAFLEQFLLKIQDDVSRSAS